MDDTLDSKLLLLFIGQIVRTLPVKYRQCSAFTARRVLGILIIRFTALLFICWFKIC